MSEPNGRSKNASIGLLRLDKSFGRINSPRVASRDQAAYAFSNSTIAMANNPSLRPRLPIGRSLTPPRRQL